MTISLCMIVRDEEKVLKRCLESVKDLTDEIIIVDTGSKDKTKNIASQYGNVYDFEWCDDFSKARNYAFSKASKDYIIWLDADDFMPKECIEKLITFKLKNLCDADVIMMPYHLDIDKNGNPSFVYYRERILKRDKGFLWQGAVHECIQPKGKIIYIDAYVEHKKDEKERFKRRNLEIYKKQLKMGCVLDTRSKFYYARELLTNNMIDEAIDAFNNFINDENAWIENKIEAYKNLASCYYLKDDFQNAKKVLIKSFECSEPRAEICCDLAMACMKLKEYKQAENWYKIAYNSMPLTENGGFVNLDCYGYLPCIGLCVCNDFMGNKNEAKYWNERAAIFKPNSKAVLANRTYFNNL